MSAAFVVLRILFVLAMLSIATAVIWPGTLPYLIAAWLVYFWWAE
jgi:hypothetical protein